MFVFQSDLELFGFPRVGLDFRLTSDDRGTVAARLCDVFPSGEARSEEGRSQNDLDNTNANFQIIDW